MREPLQDDALVIRGVPPQGMSAASLRRRIEKDRDRLGFSGISVFGAPCDLQELVSASNLPHDHLQRSTAGRIRRAGFELVPTGRAPHFSVKIDKEPTDDVIEQLISTFDPAERSP